MTTYYPLIIETSPSMTLPLMARDVMLTASCWLLYLYALSGVLSFFRDLFYFWNPLE